MLTAMTAPRTSPPALIARVRRRPSPHGRWAATASWLHPKDHTTAQLLERRRATYKRADALLRQVRPVASALPERLSVLNGLRARCEGVQAALLPPTILMGEEIEVSDSVTTLSLAVASSGLGAAAVLEGAPPSPPLPSRWRELESDWERDHLG